MSRPVNPSETASFVQQVQSLSFPLLFDGAMGTLYPLRSQKHLTSSEMACLDEPEIIEKIHMDYIDAGAQAIKTNTFAVSQMLEQGDEENAGRILQAAAEIAQKAVLQKKKPSVRIFGDIGPVQQEIYADPIYVRQAQALYDSGIRHFLIETASDFRGIQALVEWKKRQPEKIFLLTSFAVGADGFTKTGKEGKELLLIADQTPGIDAMGFNCLCGPHHMYSLQKDLPSCSKPVSMMPNAGYPTIVGRQVSYEGSDEYFGGILRAMAENGIQILGGCCGTTPDHIRQTAVSLADLPAPGETNPADRQEVRFTDSHDSLYARFSHSQKMIAVELDPPKNDRISGFMENVSRLAYGGADCITLADCPIGRPRADSCLLACKIRRELGIDVLPHMTCRDRNLNATKALLLGLSMEDIHSILLVTGDPLPSELRDEVQSVFSFNSRRLAEYISSLQADTISAPFHLFGALNLNARNFDVQLRIAAEKEAAGMVGFLTQPVHSHQALENLKKARAQLKGRILGGILPIVSERNAAFLANEVGGMDICDEITALYQGKNREQAEETAQHICTETARAMAPFVDGFYIMTPFNRVGLVENLIHNLKQENLLSKDIQV